MISFKNKKGLGRGLSSLIGEGKVSSNTKASISDLTRKYTKHERQANSYNYLNMYLGLTIIT